MIKILRKFMQKIAKSSSDNSLGNVKIELQRIATNTTAKFVAENMVGIQSVDTWQSVHDIAGRYANNSGLIMEFGVFSAKTTNYIAQIFNDKIINGFDSFEGLPEVWRDGFGKGHFALSEFPKIRSNVVLHQGWFENSIPIFLENCKEDKIISYLHIDCDLYSSTKTIFDKIKFYFVSGTVIVFDEYFNYDGWEFGEYLAFKEFIDEGDFAFEYLTYNYMHEQVAVRLIKL